MVDKHNNKKDKSKRKNKNKRKIFLQISEINLKQDRKSTWIKL